MTPVDVCKRRAWQRFVDAWCAAEELATLAPAPSDEVLDEADCRIRHAIAVCEEMGIDCELVRYEITAGGTR